MSVSPASNCNHSQPAEVDPELTVDGNVIDTGRYEIHVKKNEVLVKDRHSNTWTKAWGDPHLVTSDGDKGQFHKDNLTLDLQDGTKVTIAVTEPNAKGIALIDSASVMKGNDAVEVTGISQKIQMGEVKQNAGEIDAKHDDGTVMYAGNQVDDLFFNSTETELVGGDPSQRWGEHLLDGQGGVSANQFDKEVEGDKTIENTSVDGASVDGIDYNASIDVILMQILHKLEDALETRVKAYGEKADRYADQQNQIAEADRTGQKRPEFGEDQVTESDLQEDMAEIQKLRQLMSQITTMASNLSKTDHDAKMSVANNMRA